MSPITLAIEVVLAVMLAACLFYFWRLDRKLAQLRSGQDGVLAAAAELAQATAQAEQAVRALRATAQEAGRDLQARIDGARATADRLGIGAGRLRSAADASARGRV
jgi:cell division protein ZapA (FtsZ GTPase activity inhibitor)